ncbi:thermonuclease family protein [Ferrovibrio sp.]|uniref:thermonuclease family protein n=1 Tax=Ferrovibrio sp. TaxID=1917215 RepID=UPI0025C4570E|nr:thermonuclease family protein [Ferrovibrio sp.]MBX3455809.1 thermonuclease family protein [Ferrovibrio sp.]
MPALILILAALALFAADPAAAQSTCLKPPKELVEDLSAPRAMALDGDTLRLETGYCIRLAGLDAPELNQPGGFEARSKLDDLLLGNGVKCSDTGARSRDRIVATCSIGNGDIGEALLISGLVRTYRSFLPGLPVADRYLDAESVARKAERGLWQSRIDFTKWLYDWQTLIASIFGALIAGGSVYLLLRQIKMADQHFQETVKRWSVEERRKERESAKADLAEARRMLSIVRQFEDATRDIEKSIQVIRATKLVKYEFMDWPDILLKTDIDPEIAAALGQAASSSIKFQRPRWQIAWNKIKRFREKIRRAELSGDKAVELLTSAFFSDELTFELEVMEKHTKVVSGALNRRARQIIDGFYRDHPASNPYADGRTPGALPD